jgi:sugar lactone lactonase YvrE
MAKVQLVHDAKDIVGESIVWDEESGALIWVDIVGMRIHRLQPATGDHDTWATPSFVTSIGLRTDGRLVVGLEREVALWTFGGAFETFSVPEPHLPANRLNEGKVGPDGCYWVGTMATNLDPDGTPKEAGPPAGRIYRIGPDGRAVAMQPERYGITNTLAFTPDSRLLVADTLANEIYQYPITKGEGTLGARSLFAGAFHRGLPDGSVLDAEGYLWNCRVAGGGCVVRYAPDGQINRVIDLPCSWPTSCTFGGENLETLYVTSARFTQPPDHLARNPLEGALFSLETGIRGLPEWRMS